MHERKNIPKKSLKTNYTSLKNYYWAFTAGKYITVVVERSSPKLLLGNYHLCTPKIVTIANLPSENCAVLNNYC
jgi:hypothetical protein